MYTPSFMFIGLIAELRAREAPLIREIGKPMNARNLGFGYDVTVRP